MVAVSNEPRGNPIKNNKQFAFSDTPAPFHLGISHQIFATPFRGKSPLFISFFHPSCVTVTEVEFAFIKLKVASKGFVTIAVYLLKQFVPLYKCFFFYGNKSNVILKNCTLDDSFNLEFTFLIYLCSIPVGSE